MNSKEAVERLREIEERIDFICCKCKSCKGYKNEILKEANEIYEKFKNGCGIICRIEDEEDMDYLTSFVCGNILCPNCQEIKKIVEEINGGSDLS